MKKSIFLGLYTRFGWIVSMACLLLPRLAPAQSSGTNPVINIVSPTNGEDFASSSDIPIIAKTTDSGGTITNVEYFAGTNEIGIGNFVVLDPPGINGVVGLVNLFLWDGVPPGTYALTAVATDDQGQFATSPPVNITVEEGPVVNIVAPTNGQIITPFFGIEGPVEIQIFARAGDSNSPITNVEFFANEVAIGNVARAVILDPPGINGVTGPAYLLEWTDVPVGAYSLTAVAMDKQGASAISPPVNITVARGPLPLARITSPANHAVFRAPVDIPITAFAHDSLFQPSPTFPTNGVTNVEFFAGTNDLGAGHHLTWRGPFPTDYILLLPNQFGLVWSNAPAGSYPLTAVATDKMGVSATSAPVNITILPAAPPLTNLPDVVTIVATDPIAVAGTNSWFWHGPVSPIPVWTNWPPTNGQTYTNWGPKDALFTVFRRGSTESNLDVAYSIGGTATNGTDYAVLPGTVSIPAGASSAMIAIVPIDNGPAPAKTVVLTLPSSTNDPPAYLVGVPAQAEALILANWLRPLPFLLSDGSFHFNEPGPDGAWFRADWSSNLLDWLPICTNQVFQGSIDFLDPDAPDNPLRYYRVVPIDGPP